jgi:hypothetical protein
MIARRRVAFFRLCDLLRTIEADKDNLDAVRTLNLALLKEILRDEAHVLRLRDQVKDLTRQLRTEGRSREETRILRTTIAQRERAVERYLDQLFVWRSIADGLAYAYIHTFNIKHAFFDTASTDPKPKAGFITGKSGLLSEVALLLNALDHKVPAVLSDLTNIIRYGDICLLGGADPVPIEAKSRPGLNQRGKRQAQRLAELDKFLENDHAETFRGVGHVRRVEFGVPHRDCIADVNACIQAARRDGWNAVCPERGLVYIADFKGLPIEELFVTLDMKRPGIFMLNGVKNERSWAPYLPFINSIRDLKDLYDFVVGNLSVIVIVDAAVVCDRLVIPGWKASLLDDVNYAILLEHQASGAKIAISSQFVQRLGFEFMSLDWFAAHQHASMTGLWESMRPDEAAASGLADDPAKRYDAMPRLYESGSDAGV